jgi:xanthine dehydrogenase YagR molybdenum-binding subunit
MENKLKEPFMPPIDRVDGKLKVTGAAKYSAEYNIPQMAYGVMVGSSIAKGIILSMDTKAAENAPGVLGVITPFNIEKPAGYNIETSGNISATKKGFNVFDDKLIRFSGQPIAIVMADSYERALHAATLIKVNYKKDSFQTNLEKAIPVVKPLEGNAFKDYTRGDVNAWKTAPVKIEAEYNIPIEVHNPMELHAITVHWETPDKVLVYEKTQSLMDTQEKIMELFGLKKENVHIITKFIGGAFGSAFNVWPHAVAALIGAKQINKPLKVVLSRDQMFMNVGYRPQSIQKISIGAQPDGKITGINHEAISMTASYQEFTEGIVNVSRMLYDIPNVFTRYKVYPMDLSLPTWMRGPGETTGAYALECAIDELAHALKMDPLKLRLLNYSDTDLEKQRPYSSKYLKEAFEIGSEKIGWNDRHPEPRSMPEGDWLAGYGMGSGVFIGWRGGAQVGARFTADGKLLLQSAVTDMGPGTATAMTKLAAETFGISPDKIVFEMGDSSLPPGIMQGGSGTTSSLGTTVNNATLSLKKKLFELVKNKAVFHTETIHDVKFEDVVFENGQMMLSSDHTRKMSYSDILESAGLDNIEFIEETKGFNNVDYSTYAYAAHFVKVLVHPATGVIKMEKIVSAVDGGTIVNDKTARSQIIGGVVGGIGMALMEEGVVDNRYGRWVNNNFADYHVPVNADVPHIEALFVNKPDPILNPMGSKGIGEVAMVGFAAAVANAVFHATGKRIRALPITPDKII